MMSSSNRNHVSQRRGAPRWLPGVLGLLVLAALCGGLGAYMLAPVLSPASAVPQATQVAAAPAPGVPVVTYPSGQNQVTIVEKPVTPPPAPEKKTEPENTITTTIEADRSLPPAEGEDKNSSTRGRDRTERRGDDALDPASQAKSGAGEAPRVPTGAAETTAGSEPGITIEPAPAEAPRPTSPPAATPAERPSSEGGSLFRVQVGRFAEESDARALAEELKRDGLAPSIIKTGPDGKGLYRVQVGTYRQRENADKALDALRRKQLEPYLAEDEP
jgi:cell division protein FtsN